MLKRAGLIAVLTVMVLVATVAPTMASDHLFNAANARGASVRGFTNPVVGNPSGISGPQAQPGTVPGEGDPKVGGDQGMPAVDLGLVNVRSGGHGGPKP